MDYFCTVGRNVITDQFTDSNIPITRPGIIYQKLQCSYPEGRIQISEDVDVTSQVDRFTIRVPRLADIKIGDRVTNIRDINSNQIFDDLVVTAPFKRRTHMEIRARRVS